MSIKQDTLFDKTHLSFETMLCLIFLYIPGIRNYKQSKHELSTATICNWLKYFHEIQLEAIVCNLSGKIGGPNCMVEFDYAYLANEVLVENGRRKDRGQLAASVRKWETLSWCYARITGNSSTLITIIDQSFNNHNQLLKGLRAGM